MVEANSWDEPDYSKVTLNELVVQLRTSEAGSRFVPRGSQLLRSHYQFLEAAILDRLLVEEP